MSNYISLNWRLLPIFGLAFVLQMGSQKSYAGSCTPAPAGVLGWWQGNGGPGDVLGLSGGESHGESYAAGRVGQAFVFDGAATYVQVADSRLLSPHLGGAGELTLEAWVFMPQLPDFDSATGQAVRSVVVKGSPGQWEYGINMTTNGVPGFVVWQANGYGYGSVQGNPITTNQWHHLAGVLKKGSFIRLYVDGQLVQESTGFSGDTTDGSSPLYIGRRGDGQFFNGSVDEVTLYGRALTGSEISAVFAAGADGKCSGVVGVPVPYGTDFESGIGSEWMRPQINAEETLGFTRFSGRFGNDGQMLTLTNLTPGVSYTVGFDFYPIDSWDGDPSDSLCVNVNGGQVFRNTFANYNGNPPNGSQSYPGQPDEGRANYGFNPSFVDAIYRNIEVTFTATNSVAIVQWIGQGLQEMADESWGMDNVSVRRSDTIPDGYIRSTSLPASGTTNNDAMDQFVIAANTPLSSDSAVLAANYSLKLPGVDGVFGTGDDLNVPVTASIPGNGGHSVLLTVTAAPLQPGRYQFVASGLQTTGGKSVQPYTNVFTIANPSWGTIESAPNGSIGSATLLGITETPKGSGFYTGVGVGEFTDTGDADYWRIDVEAGDVVTVRMEAESLNVYPQISFRNASESTLASDGGDYAGVAQIQNFTISTPGSYYVRAWSDYRRSRYWLRVDISRQQSGPQLESEPNDTIASANTLALTISSGLYQARVAGSLPESDSKGDFYNLGILNPGNAVSLSMLYPASSTISNQTVLTIWSADTSVALVTNVTGALNYTVTASGNYYVCVQSTNLGIRAQYILAIAVSDTVPPAITDTSLPAEGTATFALLNGFTLDFSEFLYAPSVNAGTNYDLRGAGSDGVFGTSDDVLYVVSPNSYSSGTEASYTVANGPLQPGRYRLTVSTNLSDRAANTMAVKYMRNFTVTNLSGYAFETRSNDVAGMATLMGVGTSTNWDGTVSFLQNSGANYPRYVATGSFGGDTNLDIAYVNWNGGTVTIATNLGNGMMGVSTNIATGDNPVSVVAGDFNKDGYVDLAVANYGSSTVTILLGSSNGQFTVFTQLTGFGNPFNLAVADLNGDGQLDLVVPNTSWSSVTVLLGRGDGNFDLQNAYSTGSYCMTAAIGDVNGDGKPDIVTANYNASTVSVLTNAGAGAFAVATNMPSGPRPRYVAIADVTGDGIADMVVLQPGNNTVGVFAGNGNATFQDEKNYVTATTDAYQFQVADLNGDGKKDLIIGGFGNSVVSILQNNGVGVFTNVTTFGVNYPIGVTVADFNHDGIQDVVTANYYNGNASIWLGNGVSAMAESPASSGVKSSVVRGSLLNRNDVDYYRFSGVAGDQAVVAIEVPSHDPGSSLRFDVETADGSSLTSFTTDYYGYGQSGNITLPVTGTYLVRVSYNYDYQAEYRIRVTTVHPPMQLESEGNDTINAANGLTFSVVTNHLKASVAGYIGYNDNGDFYSLGNLLAGSTVTVGERQPASSGIAAIIGIYNAAGTLLTNSAAGATNFSFTVPAGQDGVYYARVTLAGKGAFATSGTAVGFNVSGDSIGFGNWMNSQVFTFSMQVNPTSSQNSGAALVDNGYSSGLSWTIRRTDTANQYAWQAGDGSSPITFTLSPDTWQQITVTRDSTNINRVYVNGQLVGTASGSGQINYPGSPAVLTVGNSSSGGANWYGMVDDVRLWNKWLSDSEVTAGVTLLLTGMESGLMGYWPLNEGYGLSGGDLSASNHVATLAGHAAWVFLGTTNAAPAGLTSQYILDFDLANVKAPQITAVNLPANGSTVSNIITGFTVNFSEDMNPAFTRLGNVFYPYNGHLYLVTDSAMSWNDAEAAAVRMGGHLASIRSEAENAWIFQTFASKYGDLWIGGVSSNGFNRFSWSSGEPFDFTKWYGSEPNNGNGNETAVSMPSGNGGGWVDNSSAVAQRGVIEISSVTDTDHDGLPDVVDPYPTDPMNAFDLRAAGVDGVFDTADDVVYRLSCGDYTSGLAANFVIVDGPLQAGAFRFEITTALKDRFGNALTVPYTRYFTNAAVEGFIEQNRRMTNGVSSTSLSVAPGSQSDGSLANSSTLGVGSNPYFVVTGDFNKDGNLDLAYVNIGDSTVTIETNDGNGRFVVSTNIGGLNGPISAVAADFNGDGKLDLLVANYYGNTVMLLTGDGAGGFTLGATVGGFSNPRNLTVGDFNHDGLADFAVPNRGNGTVSVVLGGAGGTFGSKVDYAVGTTPETVACADLDGDGKLDLVAANYSSSTLSVLKGIGDGTFAAATSVSTISNPHYVTVGDVTGDGKLDLVVVSSGNQMSIHPGVGDGTFGTRTDYTTGGYDTYQVVLADLDGNGTLDVVIAGYGNSRLITMLNQGDGTFGSQVSYSLNNSPISVVTGDFNKDGRVDIATANYYGSSGSIFLGNRTQGLALDPSGTGLWIAAGRGNIVERSDYDYWTFSAEAGQMISIATENPGLPGSSSLLYRLYSPDGSQWTYFYSDGNGLGDISLTIPASGTYTLRVEQNNTYSGEYRFRISLADPPTQLEVEDNSSLNKANAIEYDLSHGQRMAFVEGAIGFGDDGGDYYQLGNLGAGTQVGLSWSRPSTSRLSPVLELYNASGTLLTNTIPGQTNLVYTLGTGESGVYYARVKSSFPARNANQTNGLYFNANYTRVDVGAWAPGAQWTLQAWVMPTALPSDRRTVVGGVGGCRDWAIVLSNGYLGADVGYNSCVTYYMSPTRALLNTWYHVAVSCDGTNAWFYVNGQLTASGPVDVNYTPYSGGTWIGGESCCGGYFPGVIQDVSIWQRALTGTEINGYMATSPTGSESGLMGGWTLRDGAGTMVSDLSPNGHNGTLVNGPSWQKMGPVGSVSSGIMQQYLLAVGLKNAIPPSVVSVSLPGEGTATGGIWDRFNVTFSEDMSPVTVSNAANYSLVGAGADNTFGTSDDVVYTILNSPAYTTGTSATYYVTDGPLQPGMIRFVVSTNVTDPFGTYLPTNYLRNFTVTNVPGYTFETRHDNVAGQATSLAPNRSNQADGAFTAGNDLVVGNAVERLAAGYLDGDSHLDIAAVQWNSGTVAVLLGDGKAGFTIKTNYPTGNGAWGVALGKFDSGNTVDMAVVNYYANTVTILLGNGDGTFKSGVNYAVGTQPYDVAVADVNADGKLDLVIPNWGSGNVSVLLGNGDGTFQAKSDFNCGSNPGSIAVSDVNGDGKPDLLVANYGANNVSVLLGHGDGTFAAPVVIPVGISPRAIATADFNADGKVDLAVFNTGDNTVSVMFGNGDGSFKPRVNYAAGTSDGYAIIARDLNGDGAIDLIVGGYNSYTVNVLLNKGDGSFATVASYSMNGRVVGLATGDFNEDGRVDVAVGSDSSSVVTVLKGNDTQTLAVDPVTGLRMGAGRGNLYDSSQYDYWSFDALANDVLYFATENPGNPSASSLNFRIYGPDGKQVFSYSPDYYGRGQVSATCALAGTYTIRVSSSYSYWGEYRFRITLARPPVQVESEGNDDYSSADALNYDLSGGHRLATVLGYIGNSDSGDVFQLGKLAQGGVIRLSLKQPLNSGLLASMAVLDGSGNVVKSSPFQGTNLTYTVPAGASGNYYARVLDSGTPGALKLGGVDGYALRMWGAESIYVTNAVIPSSGDFTVECWAYATESSSYREIVSQGTGGNAFYLGTDGSRIRAGDGWSSTGVSFPFQGWHHFAVVKTSSDTMLYVDGVLVGSHGSAIPNPVSTGGFRIGRQYGSYAENWLGMIDEVRVWSVARQASDIQANYTNRLTGSETGLAGYWRLDEGSGSMALDGSASGNHGVISGSPMYLSSTQTNITASGIFSQYLLGIDIADTNSLAITSVSLPGASVVSSGVIDRFTMGVSRDINPAINNMDRDICVYNGHAYTITPDYTTWYDAEQQAQALGGHLVIINDSTENAWVAANFGGYGNLWIGLTDEIQKNNWAWVDGSSTGYLNWASGQPSGNKEDYVSMNGSGGQWSSEANNRSYTYGLIEVSGKDSDGDGIPDTLDSYPNDRYNGFDLRSSGADGAFDTADDEVYHLNIANYSSGQTLSFSVTDGPLQPGNYRFMATSAMRDLFGNSLSAPYVTYFTVTNIAGYVIEARTNNASSSAMPLSWSQDAAGLKTLGVRGNLANSSDSDWYSFSGTAGDLFNLATYTLGSPGGSMLRYRLFKPDGTRILDYTPSYYGDGESAPLTLPVTGVYTVQVASYYDYQSEYRLRLSLVTPPVQMESEDNDSIATANVLTLTSGVNSRSASVVGRIRIGADLDYYNLGTVTNGSSIILNVRQPGSSDLQPVVSVYSATGVYLAESAGGRSTDGLANVPITADGVYYALVRSSGNNGGLDDQYILDVNVVPTGSVNFPNLIVSGVTPPTGASILSGQNIVYSFNVANVGNVPTATGNWLDRAVLSQDTILGNGDDIALGFFAHNGVLGVSESYGLTNQFKLPDGISGDFYVIVQTDSGGAVNEYLFKGDNTSVSTNKFHIGLAPYPDLVVENMSASAPTNAAYTVTWSIANRGTGPVSGGFYEQFLVRNKTTGELLVTNEVVITNTLATNALLAQTRTFTATNPGVYLAIVTVDSHNDIYEFNVGGHLAAEANNAATNAVEIIAYYKVALQSSPTNAGTLTGDGSFASGSAVTVNATPVTSSLPYLFVNWTENGTFQSASSNYTFILSRDRSLTANFTLPTYLIGASNNPVGAGVVNGQGSYTYGTTNVLSATANFGYRFANWTENGSIIGVSSQLTNIVTSNRVVVANYTEANLIHVVTTGTSPTNVAVVGGAGTFNNGQSTTITAPASVTNPPSIYNFRQFLLNGVLIGTSRSFTKTFSTLDPTNMVYTAVYDTVSILPRVTNIVVNYTNVVPATTNARITFQFERSMKTNGMPLVTITNLTGTASPTVPAGGVWSSTATSNDTFTTPAITFASGMDGSNAVWIANATDLNNNVLVATNPCILWVDATAPVNPILSLTGSNNVSATISWSAYVAPADLNGLRVYLSTNPFTSSAGLTAVSAVGAPVRAFTLTGLALDTAYYVAVAAVDTAGNSSSAVNTLNFTLASTVPPPVTVRVTALDADSAQVDWAGYETASLLGFSGFQVYYETTNFTSVTGHTVRQLLTRDTFSTQIDNLDRSRTYYIAVVGFNGLMGLKPTVSTATWKDPFAGQIGVDTTISGVVDILQSITVVSNATLTVSAGTTLRFAPGVGVTVQNGSLKAIGTALDPICFTSSKDGAGQGANAGDWNGILLAGGAGSSVLKYVYVQYGNGLTVTNCSPTIDALTVINNAGTGLSVSGSSTVNTTNALVSGNDVGVQQLGAASLTVVNSVVKNNATNAVALGGLTLHATNVWWGSSLQTDIDATLRGAVDRTGYLMGEPLLTPAIGTSNNVTQVGAASVNLRLACRTADTMRLSEDSSFTSVFFTPFTNNSAFALSAGGGLKTVFAQFRSVTGQTNTPVSVSVTYITTGPTISSFNMAEGDVLSRPFFVSGEASAPMGMKTMELYVDDKGFSTNSGGSLLYWFDVRVLSAGTHRIKLVARDTSGNIATRQLNAVIAVNPPPSPYITTPSSDWVINSNRIAVAGSAEPFISVQLINSGVLIGSTNAAANGSFNFSNVMLNEGVNQLVVQAVDSVGSARSANRSVTVDTVAPAQLILDPPTYQVGSGLILSWHYAASGKRASAFQVFWSKTPIADASAAQGHTVVTTSTSTTIQGLADGTYYFYVIGYDAIGNDSPLSAPVTFTYDATPPMCSIGFDKASPVGVGLLHVILTSSEALSGIPSLTVQPYGSTPVMMTLSNTALNTYEGNINVTALLPSGQVAFRVTAQDLAGNVFNGAPAGSSMVIDVLPPSGDVAISMTPPIQTTNATNVAVTLRLSEAPKAGTKPVLQFAPPTGALIDISLSGTGTNWAGLLNLTPDMGSGFGHFILTVSDSLDNVGHSINSGSALELYNTGLPSAPGQPVNFHGSSISGGRVALTWDVVTSAEYYRIYCQTGTTFEVPTNVVQDNVMLNKATNLPSGDGYYRYVVTALRRGAEGVPSIVRVVKSDRTPPSAPTGLQVQSVAQGLQITWIAGAGETPDHYNVYRNGTLIQSVSTVTPVIDYPPRGTMSYLVAAVDALGNEASSDPVSFQLLVGAVRDFQVLVNVGQAPVLSWSPTDDTTAGYNVYRNGVKQNATVLKSPTFTDSFSLGAQSVTYSVTAVNSTNAESVPRQVAVHSVGLGLLVNSPDETTAGAPIASYFDKYQVAVSNLSSDAALPVAQVQVQRTAVGASPLTLTDTSALSVAAMGFTNSIIVVPSMAVSSQSVSIRVAQQTGSDGSSVVYQRVFALADVQNPGLMIDIHPNQLPLAGGYASFTVTLYNRGVVPIYLATTRGSGAQAGDLYIAVKNPQGQEVSRGAYNGTPAGVVFNGDTGYLSIAGGASTTLVMTNVLVPEALASNIVTFQVVASAIYDRWSSTGQQVSGPLTGATQSSLTQTPYYGIANTAYSLYTNNQPIVITGKAIDRVTGLPVPNAPLKIGFYARGCVWYVNVTNDATGNFSYTYTPTPGFAGSLAIWAAHPLVFDRLNQVQVQVYRLYVTPQESAIRMSMNDQLPFSVSVVNPGDQDLTGFSVDVSAYRMQGTNQIPVTTLTGTMLSDSSFTVPAGQRSTLQLKLASAMDAPTNAVVVYTIKSAEGASAVFVGDVTLTPAVPVLNVIDPTMGYVEVSLNRGTLLSRQVTVVNGGLRDLKGVTLMPPTNVNWMVVNLPTNSEGVIALPDIPVGQSNAFTVVFVPPTNTDLGFFQDKLTIKGTNTTSTFDVNLYARITSINKGAVQFYVDNVLGLDVPNATVRLRNLDLQVELPAVQTDINGLVTVTNLQEGEWSWQIGAAGHSANVGVVTVIPDQTVNVSTRLNKSVVTINFTVVPVPYTDRYEITIEQTFETHVPLPVLVLDPTYKQFDNVTPGFEATFVVTAKNEGLIQMENLTITGQTNASATFTPLISYIPVLLPQQMVEIPFTVTYSGTNGNGPQGNPLVDCIPDPRDIGKDIPGFIEGLRAIANAEGRCYKDNTLLAIAGGVAIGMKLYQDISQFTAGIAEQAASYIGCVIGSLLSDLGGGGGGSYSGSSSSAFEPRYASCFARGTPVLLADGTTKPIESLVAGDVLRSGTRSGSLATVSETYRMNATAVREIGFGEASIITTDDHLLWVDGRGWVTAGQVRVGEWFLTAEGGRVQVTRNEKLVGEREVFTLKLTGDVAFYANGILVHDLCGAQAPPGKLRQNRVSIQKQSVRVNPSK